MDELRNNHSDGVDEPLAHEAGVNHTINSTATQHKARNLRTANYLARQMLWDQQEKIDLDTYEITEENTMDINNRL